jgi:short-subunit dehydrogenase
MQIQGKRVVITGSRTGIGWALAKSLARRGATLHLVQRSWDLNQVEELKQLGAAEVIQWTCDLGGTSDVVRLGDELAKQEIEMVINNAGSLTGDLLEKQTVEEISAVFQVNLVSAVLLTRALLPGMIERRRGLVVNNASVSAIMRFPCASTYAASKAGLLAFTECLENELVGTGVRTLSLLTPGIDTEMFAQMNEKYSTYFEAPQERISPEEFAEQVIAAIEGERPQLLPAGLTGAGLFLAKHTPALFRALAMRGFSRKRSPR